MGVDFITTCTKTFEKSWDRGRDEMAEPSLFTDIPTSEKQTFVVLPRLNCQLMAGRWYEVVIDQDRLVLLDGIEIVGDFSDVPKSAMKTIEETGCKTAAAYVHTVHELSGAADVTLR